MPRLSFALTACALLALTGCNANKSTQTAAEHEAECLAPKEGTITSVNRVCPVVMSHPVNPATTSVLWKGQEVGFCCEGCKPGWNKMSDSQKDAALASAMAKSN
jgi:hypothetical protein